MRSPCFNCERLDEDKNQCVKTCKALQEYREWEKTAPWMPPPTHQPGNGDMRKERVMTGKMTRTGAEIKAIREGLGWTQARFAGELGISQRRVSQIEREDPPASPEIQRRIWRLFVTEGEPEATPEVTAVCPRPGCTNPAGATGNRLCKSCRVTAAEAGHLRHLAKALQKRDPEYAAGLEIEAILVRFGRDEWDSILARIEERYVNR